MTRPTMRINETHGTDTEGSPRRVILDEVEARLPIPDDVIVAETDDGPAWFRGTWSPARRVILLRAGLGEERAFTLAHELAHCLLGHPDDGAAQEAEADAYAAVLLEKAEQSAAAGSVS